ncbi:MAG: winged helix-turn-helix domain-containing protein [Candidatus Nitrosopolaris sp.]|jgi:predicted transcriptional regulator
MEIYNDVLNAIAQELTDGEAKPTRVQILSNLAYDKLVRYLNDLEGKKMIIQDPLGITERGRDFLEDYDRIKDFILTMGVKYLDI